MLQTLAVEEGFRLAPHVRTVNDDVGIASRKRYLRITPQSQRHIPYPQSVSEIQPLQLRTTPQIDAFHRRVAHRQLRDVREALQKAVVVDHVLPSALVEHEFCGSLSFYVSHYSVAIGITIRKTTRKHITVLYLDERITKTLRKHAERSHSSKCSI